MAEVKLTFLGDLMCQMQQIRVLGADAAGYQEAFAPMKSVLESSDFVVANLETPIAGRRMRYAFEETRFNAPNAFLDAVKALGISFVSTANNHCMDRGVRGLDETLTSLDRLKIQHVGTYRDQKDAESACVVNVQGVRIGFVSCTYEMNQGRKSDLLPEGMEWKVDQLAPPIPFHTTWAFAAKRFLKGIVPYRLKQWVKTRRGDVCRAGDSYLPDSAGLEAIDSVVNAPYVERLKDKIRAVREVADFVVVLPHMGGQYNPEPGPYQKWTVRWMAEAGADAVICNHAHTVLQSETLPNGTFVAYALGNFSLTPGVGYYRKGCQADCSVVLNLWIDTDAKKICRKSFSVTENVLRADGVSVVQPADAGNPETKAVVRRFAGKNIKVGIDGEYVF